MDAGVALALGVCKGNRIKSGSGRRRGHGLGNQTEYGGPSWKVNRSPE